MVVNGTALLADPPIVEMLSSKHRLHGVSHGLAEVGYDIRIKQDIFFRPAHIHFTGQPLAGPKHSIGANGDWNEGNFCIASAIEEFDMPNHLMGIVHDKSTWARQGLSVFNTVIEPGWKGFLTLELVYHGSEGLYIPAGSGIAQVVFHQIAQPAAYSGKYQNQADEPVPALFV
jgi:dCTP deaminase